MPMCLSNSIPYGFFIKYRKKILFYKDRVEFFKEICSEIGERYWFEFDAIDTDGNHVHIFVGAAPRYAPSRIMQIIKSITAKNIFKKYPDIKKKLWRQAVPKQTHIIQLCHLLS